MRTIARHATALSVVAAMLAACGGGSENTTSSTVADSTPASVASAPPRTAPSTTTPPTTAPATTESPATVPPTTEPATADLPDWASGEMVTVGADVGPIEIPVELAPFCESSRTFYIASHGLDYLTEDDTAAIEQLLSAQIALLPAAIETAPSAEFAAHPIAASEQLAVIVPALAQVGYTPSRLTELDDAETVFDALNAFGETQVSLKAFLVEACGAEASVLDEQAAGAAEVALGDPGATPLPVDAVEGTPIRNAAGTIALQVPTDWTDIEESVESGRDQIVASADIAGFFALTTPGAVVLRGEGGFRDGGFVGRSLEFQSLLEDIACTLVDETDYDDGLYVGSEQVYGCGNDDLEVRVFGGSNADESLYAIVMLVQPIDEQGIRQLIVNTFEVV